MPLPIAYASRGTPAPTVVVAPRARLARQKFRKGAFATLGIAALRSGIAHDELDVTRSNNLHISMDWGEQELDSSGTNLTLSDSYIYGSASEGAELDFAPTEGGADPELEAHSVL